MTASRWLVPAVVAALLAAALCLALAPGCGDGVGGRLGGEEPVKFTDVSAGIPGVTEASLAWGDYDNDGDLDLALAGQPSGSSRFSRAYRNDGGAFMDIGAGLTGVTACSLAWGDYDGDGDLDLAVAGEKAGLPPPNVPVSAIYDYDGAAFADIGAGLTGVWFCSLAWGDYDNDGDVDLAVAGETSFDLGFPSPASTLYGNDGGAFADIGAGLPGVRFCALAWGDYDNDGDLDLALPGEIYNNDGGSFTGIGAALTGVTYSSLAWGDYDNDGDLDLALAGYVSSGNYIAKVYRNGGGTFADISAPLPGLRFCSVAWGDYDNDGDLDLAVAGFTLTGAVGNISRIYRNDHGTFTDIDAGLTGVSDCSLAWGDYDDDGDLDLALAGMVAPGNHITKVYRNDGGPFNTPPAAPGGLGATYAGAGPYDVTFSWGHATDTETPQAGLSYNLRMGTAPGGNDVVSGMADATSGWRRVPQRGPIQPGLSVNEWTLKGLPAGTYYWSVQAVDTAFAGSAWAAEETLTVP